MYIKYKINLPWVVLPWLRVLSAHQHLYSSFQAAQTPVEAVQLVVALVLTGELERDAPPWFWEEDQEIRAG